MKAHFARIALLLLVVSNLFAQATEDDKNVTIESKSQVFKFLKAKGENPVLISEDFSVKYRCNELRTTILFSETYNNYETIDEVTIYNDGKRDKGTKPKYEYYSVNGYVSSSDKCNMENFSK
ncbi:MAG: hypothetical protein EAY75_14870 [Bacteroidetes bacterium]|nr:MAG: hypothetical protein EAY75_14870 [Bacteroidota bacterium]